MSDLSDKIHEKLLSLYDENAPDVIDPKDAKGLGDLPGLENFQAHYLAETIKALRRVYRRHSGSPPYKDPMDALNRTNEDCTKALVPVCIRALADGVQIGQGKSAPVKKANFFRKIDEIFAVKGFREESETFCLTVAADYEATERIERYLNGAVGSLASASGYQAASGANLNKVWDLWAIAVTSATMGLYAAGHALGKEWAEEEVLNGILTATEKGEEQ